LNDVVEGGSVHSEGSLGKIARVFSSWDDKGKVVEADDEVAGTLADVCFIHNFGVEEVSGSFGLLLLFGCFFFIFDLVFFLFFLVIIFAIIALSSTFWTHLYIISFGIDVKPHFAEHVFAEILIKFYYPYLSFSSC
jgi:hypothetical protein